MLVPRTILPQISFIKQSRDGAQHLPRLDIEQKHVQCDPIVRKRSADARQRLQLVGCCPGLRLLNEGLGERGLGTAVGKNSIEQIGYIVGSQPVRQERLSRKGQIYARQLLDVEVLWMIRA